MATFVEIDGGVVEWINPRIRGEDALPPEYLARSGPKMYLEGGILHLYLDHPEGRSWPVWLALTEGSRVPKNYEGRIKMAARRAEKRLSAIMLREFWDRELAHFLGVLAAENREEVA